MKAPIGLSLWRPLILVYGLLATASSALGAERLIEAPGWVANQLLYEVNIRQFSEKGDFASVEARLPQLKELGVGTLWLMPIHAIGVEKRKGTLGSYYSIRDHRSINPEFGDDASFRSLLRKARDQGMRVILDWVANHTSWDHVWTRLFPGFFVRDDKGQFVPPVADWYDVIDLNYGNGDLWRQMISDMKFWVDEYGIDGFRCDVASLVPTAFWERARSELGNVYMLAESEHADLVEEAFDSVYGDHLYGEFVALTRGQADANDIWQVLQTDQLLYPPGSFTMNYATNHDKNSWEGHLGEIVGDAAQVFTVLTFTAPGIPLVYSGQEAGLDKRLSFFERDPIEWKPDFMFQLIKRLGALKQTHRALDVGSRAGAMSRISTSSDTRILALRRTSGTDEVISVMNLSPDRFWFELRDGNPSRGAFRDIITQERLELGESHWMQLEPWGYRVFASTGGASTAGRSSAQPAR